MFRPRDPSSKKGTLLESYWLSQTCLPPWKSYYLQAIIFSLISLICLLVHVFQTYTHVTLATVRVDEIPPAQQNVYECSEQHDEGIHPPKTNTNKRGHENTTSTHTTWLTESDKLDNKSEYDDNASSCYVLMESHVIALPATRTNNDTMLNPLRGLPQIPVHLTGNYLNRANGGMDPTSPVGEHDYDYID